MTKAELIALIGERDALDTKIEAGMAELGLDKKGLREMVKAVEKAAAAQKTLNALMGIEIASTATTETTTTED